MATEGARAETEAVVHQEEEGKEEEAGMEEETEMEKSEDRLDRAPGREAMEGKEKEEETG